MTEEQAREMERTWQAYLTLPYRSKSEYKALIAGWHAALEYANRWTYCEDALPKQYDFYLVTHKTWEGDLRVSECLFAYEKWDIENVIAWRPMPDPAKIREPGPQEQVEVS